MNQMICFCGNNVEFKDCCQAFILAQSIPESPEQLMRSRYSAYCDKNIEYLIKTHWPVNPNSREQIENTANSTQWLGLKVISAKPPKENEGFVEFVAFFQQNGVQQLHEKSRFKRHQQRWFYVDGVHLPPIKLSRNDLCFCGSQKKYKKCHGA